MIFVALFSSNALLLFGWRYCRTLSRPRLALSGIWLALFMVLLVVGQIDGGSYSEVSRLGNAVLWTSGIWISGPLLIWTVTKSDRVLLSIVVAVLMPFPSMVLGVLIGMSAGQVWGL